jgi:hypothetical protein
MYGSTRAQANYQQRHITQPGDPFSRQPLAKLALHGCLASFPPDIGFFGENIVSGSMPNLLYFW